MNKVELVGRLTKDVDMRYSGGENANAFARFTVAVNRNYKNSEGVYEADFISCTAFGKTSEFINKYFHKGDLIGIIGSIRTGSYTNKDGLKVYTTDVNVENAEFVGGKNDNNNAGTSKNNHVDEDFMNIPDSPDEAPLPFE